MAINYKVIELKTNIKTKEGNNKVFSGRFVQSGKISLNEVAKEISERTSFTASDVKGLVMSLSEAITRNLLHGIGVDLGELGSFSVDLQSETTDSSEDFTARNIKRAKIRFTPSKEIKKELKRAKYKPIEPAL